PKIQKSETSTKVTTSTPKIQKSDMLTKVTTSTPKIQKSDTSTTAVNAKIQNSSHIWAVNRTSKGDCTAPWAMVGSDCLLLSSNNGVMTFYEARDYCNRQHAEADLAIPTNFTHVREYLLQKESPLAKVSLWVGGSDILQPKWLDGTPISGTLWHNENPLLNNRDCVVLVVWHKKLQIMPC
ncbi:unnamed protein product, partial [Meganyctiphanes norvegica]